MRVGYPEHYQKKGSLGLQDPYSRVKMLNNRQESRHLPTKSLVFFKMIRKIDRMTHQVAGNEMDLPL